MWIWFLFFCVCSLTAFRVFHLSLGFWNFTRTHLSECFFHSFSLILCITKVSCLSLALWKFLPLFLYFFPLSSLSSLFLDFLLETVAPLITPRVILEPLQLLLSIVCELAMISCAYIGFSFSPICFLSSRDSWTFLVSWWQSFLFISTALHLLPSYKTYSSVFFNDVRQKGLKKYVLNLLSWAKPPLYFCLIVEDMIYVGSRPLEN